MSEAAARNGEHLPHGRTARVPHGRTAKVPYGRTAKVPHGRTAKVPCGRTASVVRPRGRATAGFRSWISHSPKDPRGLWKSEHFCRSAKVPLDMSVTLG